MVRRKSSSSSSPPNQLRGPVGLSCISRNSRRLFAAASSPSRIATVVSSANHAVAAGEGGWDGFVLSDHIQYEEPVPLCDAWIALSAIATSTSTIRLGPLVTPLPRRRPWKLAREAVTLDHLSRGRLVLGVGLGIDFWREFSSFGGEAGDDAERARLLNDGINIITRLWSGEPTTYQGARLSVDGAQFLPRPFQQP